MIWLLRRPSSRHARSLAVRAIGEVAIAGAALLLLVAGCGSHEQNGVDGSIGANPSPEVVSSETGQGSAIAADEPAPEPDDSASPAPATLPSGVLPVRIEIPPIGVDADVIELDLRGPEPEVPADFAQTGWYTQTRRPGEIGPSVIAGHIDSVRGPAVFARLDELQVGDEIIIHDTEGDVRTFVVSGAGQYPKDALPDTVFGFDQPVPELRLITCGGSFDRSIGHYRDNYVVYTELETAAP